MCKQPEKGTVAACLIFEFSGNGALTPVYAYSGAYGYGLVAVGTADV